VALLEALRGSKEAQVALVLSNRPDAPALDRARDWGVPAESLRNYRDGSEWLERLKRHQVDLVVLAGYLKLVPPEVIRAYRGLILNVHPALLPAFGGPGMYGHHVHQAVLASGAAQSGATVHLVTRVTGPDPGPGPGAGPAGRHPRQPGGPGARSGAPAPARGSTTSRPGRSPGAARRSVGIPRVRRSECPGH
jgi:hypothetical protein